MTATNPVRLRRGRRPRLDPTPRPRESRDEAEAILTRSSPPRAAPDATDRCHTAAPPKDQADACSPKAHRHRHPRQPRRGPASGKPSGRPTPGVAGPVGDDWSTSEGHRAWLVRPINRSSYVCKDKIKPAERRAARRRGGCLGDDQIAEASSTVMGEEFMQVVISRHVGDRDRSTCRHFVGKTWAAVSSVGGGAGRSAPYDECFAERGRKAARRR